jgi:hypothetical protein
MQSIDTTSENCYKLPRHGTVTNKFNQHLLVMNSGTTCNTSLEHYKKVTNL